jgi:hypothetical protein
VSECIRSKCFPSMGDFSCKYMIITWRHLFFPRNNKSQRYNTPLFYRQGHKAQSSITFHGLLTLSV